MNTQKKKPKKQTLTTNEPRHGHKQVANLGILRKIIIADQMEIELIGSEFANARPRVIRDAIQRCLKGVLLTTSFAP
jgi:hypothetical protein